MKLRSTLKTGLATGLGVMIVLQGCFGAFGSPIRRPQQPKRSPVVDQATPDVSTAEFPLTFEVNQGQAEPRTKFIARRSSHSISLRSNGVAMSFGPRTCANANDLAETNSKRSGCNQDKSTLRVEFEGASMKARAVGEQPAGELSNYLIGNDPKNFLTNIRHYGRARFEQVYPGIDVVYYGAQGQLEYDFLVEPGSNPQRIALRFNGAEQIEIDNEGDLLVHLAHREIVQPKPLAYQNHEGKKVSVSANYVLKGGTRIGLELGTYDRTKPLVIDPVLDYSTYLGGGNADIGTSIAVDDQGRIYITGITTSVNFPASGATSMLRGNSDIFIARLNPSGTGLEYSTFLGGLGNEEGASIAVDPGGSAYITGTTASVDFPTTSGSFHTAFGGASDAFVTKLKADGSGFVYSTLLGGNNADEASGVALDPDNNACIVGVTDSNNFPTTATAFQLNKNNDSAVFVTKLNASGSGLMYSTYLGGSGVDWGLGIATDVTRSIYVTGLTASNDFPISLNALQTTLGGSSNSFVAKFMPSQTGAASLSYSTFLGGGNSDAGHAVAVDSLGNAYVAGSTNSTNFPTTNSAAQLNKRGSSDGFVAKLNSDGSALSYSTYLGGDCADAALAIQVDSAGQAFVSGFTQSLDFPVTPGAHQSTLAGKTDAFITKLKHDGSGLVVSTYLGGANEEEGLGIKVGIASKAYVTGETISDNFPASAPFQGVSAGAGDVFVTRLNAAETVNPSDDARFFVRQNYIDFLSREPDQAGSEFWTDNITKCSDPGRRPAGQTEALCILRQRESTSAAFFLSPEFQYTGYFVYRMYRGALGRQPKLSEFAPDTQFVGAGIVVNDQLSGAKINQNKADFAQQFVNCTDPTKSRCAAFKAIYDGLNNQQYVDKLFQTTGVNASASDRAALVNGLSANPATETRASVLQKVVDGIVVIAEGNQQFTTSYGQAFYHAEFNRAFVQMEYFGYLKRDPDDAGYAFWLGKLNQYGNFVDAEMVLAFILSPEYRSRFGQP